MPENTIISIDHVSVIVSNTVRALDFYCGVLNLEQDLSRPDLGYPGAWLLVGSQQVHLLELPNPDPVAGRPQHGGRDRHVAFRINDIAVIKNALENAGIKYTDSKSGRKALFCRDYDNNAIELIEITE